MKAVVGPYLSAASNLALYYSRIFMWRGTARNRRGPAPQAPPRGDTPGLGPESLVEVRGRSQS